MFDYALYMLLQIMMKTLSKLSQVFNKCFRNFFYYESVIILQFVIGKNRLNRKFF